MRHSVRALLAAAVGIAVAAVPGPPAFADAVRDGQWHLGFMHVAEAHRVTQGEGVTVAVIDTGVNPAQPDLTGSVLDGADGWSAADDGHDDDDGHGTAMAALIAGHGHGPGNADGVLGVAPKAKILPVGVWRAGTIGLHPEDVASGIRWAVDHDADVVLVAGGGLSNIELEGAIKIAVSRGIPVIAAAGNKGQNAVVVFPAAYPNVFGVSAVNRQGAFADTVSVSGAAISFAAPGQDIQIPKLGGGYQTASGTSASAALVAGVVALVRAKYPQLDVNGIYEHLKATATDASPQGRDSLYGWGIVDAAAAVTKAPARASASPSASAVAEPSGASSRASGDGSGMSRTGKLLLAGGGVVTFLLVVGLIVASLIGLSRRRASAPR